MRGLRQFRSDQGGGVAVMAACSGGLLCAVAAVSVDLGSLALEGRQLQGVADLAALSAARDIAHAQQAAAATTRDNLGVEATAKTLRGVYRADRSLAPAARFQAGEVQPNAARVTVSRPAPLYFGRWILGRDSVMVQRTGTAAQSVDPPRAMFSIGSRLARLDGGIENQILSALTGSTVSLTAMDYQNLAQTQVNLLTFSDALALELGVAAGDHQSLFKRKIDAGRALKVIESLAGDQADSALSRLSSAAIGTQVSLDQLIGLEADASQGLRGPLNASVSALDLAQALVEVGGGGRQAAVDLSVPAGIAELKTSLAIGERPNRSPWLTVTGTGSPIIRTAQARLYVRARTAQKLSGLAQVNLPVLIELASSEARLDAIGCKPSRSVTLGVRPGLAKATIGAVDETRLGDFKTALTPTPATVLSVAGVVSLTTSSTIEAADQGYSAVPFSDADIKAQAVKTLHTTGAVNGLITSLIGNMQVDVKVLGLGLGLGGLVQALSMLLTPLGPMLDDAINPVLDALGLKFGEADVQVLGADCPAGGPRVSLVG